MRTIKTVCRHPNLFTVILLLVGWAAELQAHEGVDHGDGKEAHPRLEQLTVGPDGRFRITLGQLPERPLTGQKVQFLMRLETELDFDDPLLGGTVPWEPSSLEIWTENGQATRSNLHVHARDEPGVYGFEHTFREAGEWRLVLDLNDETDGSGRGELILPVEAAPFNWALLLFQAVVVVSAIGMVVQRFRSPASPWFYSVVVMAVAIGLLTLVGRAGQAEDLGRLELAALDVDKSAATALDFSQPQETEVIALRQVVTERRLVGTVRHAVNRTFRIRSPLPGTVMFNGRVPQVGDRVSEGQQLGVIVNEFIHHDFAHLLNQRWELEKPLVAAREELARAEGNYQRAGSLLDLGVISKRRFDQAELTFKQASIAAEKAQARLDLHDSRLRRKDQHETALVSPISGYISQATYVAGQMINEGDPIFEIVDPTVVWVEVFAPPEQLSRLDKSNSATLRSSTLERDFEGRLVQIRPDVDEASKSLRVIYEVANPESWLRPGMLLDVFLRPAKAGSQRAGLEPGSEAGD